MSDANLVFTSLPTNADLVPASEDEEVLDTAQNFVYRAVISGLLYLAISMRSELSKRWAPFPSTWMIRREASHAFKRVIRYIIGTIDFGVHYDCKFPLLPCSFVATVDAELGGDQHTRRSTPGV